MPFGQKLLLSIPILPLGIILVVVSVVLSILGLWLVRKIVPQKLLKSHNELTNSIFGALAMSYTVLLAFVVVVSWQNFDKAKDYIQKEANCLVDLSRNSAAFPQPFRNALQAAIRYYADTVIRDEWDALGRGEESLKAREILRSLWSLYTNYEPTGEKEKIFFAESVGKLDDLREMRRLRILEAGTGVHPVLWFVLIVGGITTISFTFFFGSDSFGAHVVMASTLAVITALILFTILIFDYPFTGSMRIEPVVFQQIIHF